MSIWRYPAVTTTLCFVYDAVVNDNEADAGLSLDVIQTELETLLSSVGLRMCQLTKELDALAGDARSPAPKQESRGKELRSKVKRFSSAFVVTCGAV